LLKINVDGDPSSVEYLDCKAFYGSGIRSITFAPPNSKLKTIALFAFCGYRKLSSIEIPPFVEEIEDHAFTGSNLQ